MRQVTLTLSVSILFFPSIFASSSLLAEELRLEEVVVTARKREESMQDSPVTVSAFSAEAMERRGITNINALENVTPGLDMNGGNTGVKRSPSPYIRGVGQRLSAVVVDPSVAIYYAGVYQGRMLGTPVDVVDLQSVEVLRGPQGTLFGKNVTGGAILMNPHRPEADWFASISTGVSNNEGEQHSLTLNAPIAENLAARINYNRTRSAGHMENLLNGKEQSDDNRETWTAQLRWDISDALAANLTYVSVDNHATSVAVQCLFSADELGWDKNNFLLIALADNFIGTDFEATCDQQGPEAGLNRSKVFSDVGVPFDRPIGSRGWKSLATPGGGNNFTESEQAILQFDYAFDTSKFGLHSLSSITGWLRSAASQHSDFDGTEIPLLSSIDPELNPVDQYSQEFQFNFTFFDDRLRITSGVYLFAEKSVEPAKSTSAALGPFYIDAFNLTAVPLMGVPSLISAPAGGTAVFGVISEKLTEIDNEAAAIYAQLDYNLTEQFDLSIGLRWTDEARFTKTTGSDLDAASVHPDGNAPVFSQPALIAVWSDSFRPTAFASWRYGQDPVELSDDQRISELSPMINLKYTFTDTLADALALDGAQAFITWSTGFRSGGIERGVDPDAMNSFDPEFVENSEVGLKTDAFDRRLRANFSAYYTEYTDIQLVTTRGGATVPVPFFVNAGKAIISGFEAEISALLGSRWVFEMSLAYTNADLKEYEALVFLNGNEQVQVDRADEDMPRVSEKAGSLTATHILPLDQFGELMFTVGVNYRSEQTTHFDRGSFLTGEYITEPRYNTNLRVSWTSPDEQFQVAAYANNIDGAYTRERSGGIPLVEASGAGSFGFTPPTAYGLTLRYQWLPNL